MAATRRGKAYQRIAKISPVSLIRRGAQAPHAYRGMLHIRRRKWRRISWRALYRATRGKRHAQNIRRATTCAPRGRTLRQQRRRAKKDGMLGDKRSRGALPGAPACRAASSYLHAFAHLPRASTTASSAAPCETTPALTWRTRGEQTGARIFYSRSRCWRPPRVRRIRSRRSRRRRLASRYRTLFSSHASSSFLRKRQNRLRAY